MKNEKCRQAAIKRWSDPEYRKKLSEAHKGNIGFWKGKKRPAFSPEWCKNMARKVWNKGLKGYMSGHKNPTWKGGRISQGHGYIKVLCPEHPNNVGGYVLEHRLFMEKKLGRYLDRKEVVHHINRVKDDNNIDNLELITNQAEHARLHKKLKKQLN